MTPAPRPSGPSALAYLQSVVVTAAAVAVRWLLDPWLGDHLPLVTLFAGVAISFWYGGTWPAVLGVVLGYVACDYLFIEPRHELFALSASSTVGVVAYFVSCAIIIAFGRAMRRAQREASERRAVLQTTLASIGDAVITTDHAGVVVFMNAVAEELTGWPRDEAAGRPLDTVFRIVNEDTGQTVENPVARALREGGVVGLANHTVLVARDGTRRAIDDSASCIRDGAGPVSGCVLVFRDITARREAERRLQRSERDLSDFFDNASLGLHWVGPDGTILRVNQTELELLGYEREEYVGRHIAEFHVDRPVIDDILARLARGETLRDQPARMRRKDGAILDVLINSNVLFEDGQFIHTRCFTRDVTAQKRAEEAQALLAAIVQASDDAIVSKTLDGVITSWNAGAERIFGYTAAEAVGRSIEMIIPAERRDEEQTILERVRRGERVEHFETVRVTRAGTFVDVSLTISPVRDRDGRIIGASKIARDISQRSRTADALRTSERLLRATVSGARAGLVLVNDRYEYRFANEAYAEIIGLPGARIVGRRVAEVLPREWPQIQPRLDRALAGERVADELRLAPRPGGSRRPRDVAASYEPHSVDGEQQVVVVVVDISDRKRAEEQLQEADRRKDEFLATLAHELRNPLAPVRNSLEILKRAETEPALRAQARGTMDRQLSQMERLIDDLLDVSRITRNRLELRRQPVELSSVLYQALEACRPLAEANHHEITASVPDASIFLDGDPVRLAQVFGNLLNNACKYTEPGGHIELAVQRQGAQVAVSVRDDGIGIPTDVLPRIFELFTQADRSLERPQGGLGIGLTLVKQLVEMHGGRVEARSAGPGKGSEFEVWMPVLADAAVAAARQGTSRGRDASGGPEGSAAETDGASRRILVVDDNQDSARSLAVLLGLSGHQTRMAHDGMEALDVAEQFRPDVVLLDIGLPKLNGFETCQRLREQPWGRDLLIVALTGWGQDADRRRSHAAGFDRHMVKPVDAAALQGLIREWSGRTPA